MSRNVSDGNSSLKATDETVQSDDSDSSCSDLTKGAEYVCSASNDEKVSSDSHQEQTGLGRHLLFGINPNNADVSSSDFASGFLRSLRSDPRRTIQLLQHPFGQSHGISFVQTPSSEYDSIIENLAQRDDPCLVMEFARDLSERLLMMDGMTAEQTIPSNKLTKALVLILQDPLLSDYSELHLVVCRCLYNLVELSQDYIMDAISNNVIEAVLPRLVDIVYIDMTEQCLQLLEVLSSEKSSHHVFLENDGFSACLRNLDFLTLHSQKKCLKIVLNLSCSISSSHFDSVEEALVTLVNILLFHEDPSVTECAKLILFRIIDCYKNDSKKLELLFSKEELILQLAKIAFEASNHDTPAKSQSFVSVTLRSLIILASSSANVRKILLLHDLGLQIQAVTIAMNGNSSPEEVNFPIKSVLFDSDKQQAILLQLISCIIPTVMQTADNEFLLGPPWPGAQASPTIEQYDVGNLAIFFSQIYPVLIFFYRESMDLRLRLLVLREIYRIIINSGLDSKAEEQTKELVHIIADCFCEGKDSLFDNKVKNMSSPEISLLGAACLISKSAMKSSDSKISELLEREGVFSNLCDIERYLASSEGLKDTDLVSPNIISLIQEVKLEFVNKRAASIMSSDSYDSEALEQLRIQMSHVLLDEQSTTQDLFVLWRSFSQLITSNSCPTAHEMKSLGLLELIYKSLCEGPGTHSKAITSFVDVFFNDHHSLGQFLLLLHSILNRSQSFAQAPKGKDISLGKRPLMSRKVLVKLVLDSAMESSVTFSAKEFVILAPLIISFSTIEHFLMQRLTADHANRRSQALLNNWDPHSDKNADVDLSSCTILFTYDSTKILKATTLYGMLLGRSSSDLEANTLGAFDNYTKTHEIKFLIVPTESALSLEFPTDLEPMENATLRLINRLSDINESLFCERLQYPAKAFKNRALSQKMCKEIDDPRVRLGGFTPEWCIKTMLYAPSIFSIDLKMQFFRSVSFGLSRLSGSSGDRQVRPTQDARLNRPIDMFQESMGSQSKVKLRVSRNAVFKSALKLLKEYGLLPSILEIQFFDEVGSGLGPTLEFYSMVSRCFSERPDMWRKTNLRLTSSDTSLFPLPIIQAVNQSLLGVYANFHALGQFMARSLIDSRSMDFNFNPVFLDAIRNWPEYSQKLRDSNDLVCLLHLLYQVDPTLSVSLRRLLSLVGDQKEVPSDVSRISDLCLYFVLPGYLEYELVEHGSDILVTEENLTSYITVVADTTLFRGISRQVEAFLEGFSCLLPLSFLSLFSISELVEITGHGVEDWSMKTLENSLETDHGYSFNSTAIKHLLSIISDFSKVERRQFLQFLTGSPRLPIGGFAALNPKLTIVKKHVDSGQKTDDHLPSVMTCANYLKMPDYSLRDIMKAKILQAMREGSDSFHLS